MAIVKMKKFNLFSLKKDRKELLEKLQKFSYVNFVNTTVEDDDNYLKDTEVSTEDSKYGEESNKIQWMINYIEKYIPKEKTIDSLKKGPVVMTFDELEKEAMEYDYHEDFKNLEAISKEVDENNQNITSLESKIRELEPWIGLKQPIHRIRNLNKVEIILGYLPAKNLEKLNSTFYDLDYTYLEVTSTIKNNAYCIIVTNGKEYKKVVETLRFSGFSEVNLDIEGTAEEVLNDYKDQVESMKKENIELQSDISKFQPRLLKMKKLYEYYNNLYLRSTVVTNFKSTERLNVIEGYIPSKMENKFKNAISKVSSTNIHLELEDPDEDDPNIPIIIENNKLFSMFEPVVDMYSLPRYNEIDPTALLSLFYWTFFGMMVADFAYGLILSILTGTALVMFKFETSKKKFIQFFFALSISTMIWGLIFGSVFGDLVYVPFRLLDPAKDVMVILALSILFGGVHLYTGLFAKAYILIKRGKMMDAFYDVFLWLLTLTTLIILLINTAGVISLSAMGSKITMILMLVGMAGIVVFGARDSKTIGGRVGGGLFALYGITGYIGDFVSYLRLMALGLAGGFIAVAVNMIVRMLAGNGIIGFLLGLIVFVLAQSFNVFLSCLSAYVHSLRLMYAEFFSKFYEGGGVPFKKFRSKEKYIELK